MTDLQKLHRLFRYTGLTLAVAESCTAGLLAARLADQPGCSAWFRGGVVAYHNDLKEQLLGVPQSVLVQHGAVSEQAARAMAEGVRQVCGADLGLAVTGIAGPDGGTPEKPVGTVCVAVADQHGCQVERFLFFGGRAQVRQQTVDQGVIMLKKRLEASKRA